jgi:predicted nuclease of predicted toxin-antitoxin system
MKIKILIDMNLSPNWVNELASHDCVSVHWSTIGDPKAADREIIVVGDRQVGTTYRIRRANLAYI